MSREEWEQQQEEAGRRELAALSRLSASELMQRIESGRFGEYASAFDALAAKGDLPLIVPFLAAQLKRPLSVRTHYHCAVALLGMLPYSGIPASALADPSHPGHTLYHEDLAAHIEATFERLGDRRSWAPPADPASARRQARLEESAEKARRKRLKAEARQTLETESSQRTEALRDVIPVDTTHPDWGVYFTENTLRERRLSRNTSKVIRADRVGKDIELLPERGPKDGTVVAFEGTYIRCFLCSDILPLVSTRTVRCSCSALEFGPISPGSHVEIPQNAGLVQLFAKAQPIRWWQVWRRISKRRLGV